MSIDRTAFNALVDDPGDTTSGTPWNKNKIQTVLLDPIDAAIASSLPSASYGAWTSYTPTVSVDVGGITVNSIQTCAYTIINKTMSLNFHMSVTVTGSTVQQIRITLPTPYISVRVAAGGMYVNGGGFGGQVQTVGGTAPGNGLMYLFRDTSGSAMNPPGTYTIAGHTTFDIA